MATNETRPCPVSGHGIEPVLAHFPAADGRENVWLACGWSGLMEPTPATAPEPEPIPDEVNG